MTPGNTDTLSRPAWLGVIAVLVASFLHFWITTTPVRLATTDDVAFQQVADQGTAEEYLILNSMDQGRFLYCTPVYRHALITPYEVRDARWFALLRTLGLFSQILLAAWLAARVMQSAVLGAAIALFIAGTLHFPATFFLVLSFPPIWIGFSALLGALHCHLTWLRRPLWWSALMTGLLFLVATLMHDVFIIFTPLFPALAWSRDGNRWFAALRKSLIPLALAAAYVVVHRRFAQEFPSGYDGTRFSPDLITAGKVLVRQMAGITPGFELLVNRLAADTTGPLFRELPAVLGTLGALSWPGLLLALGLGLATAAAFTSSLGTPLPRVALWPWVLGVAVLANLPIAFSVKYQVFILHREYPYGYAWFSFCFTAIAAVCACAQLGRHLSAGRGRRALGLAFGAGVFLLSLSALASNQRVLQLLRERYN